MSNIIKSDFIKPGKVFKVFGKSDKRALKDASSKDKANDKDEEGEDYSNFSAQEKEEILKEAKLKAQEIIDKAEKTALDMKSQAQVDIKGQREEALEGANEEGFNQGFKEGMDKGREKSLDDFKSLLDSLSTEISDFKEEVVDREGDLKRDIVKLSIAISEKIIDKELILDKDIIKDIVNNTIKLLDGDETIKIKVHPKDLAVLDEFKDELLGSNNGFEKIKIVGDEGIEAGGTLIESDFGGFDATISSQLQEIENRLLEVIKDE